MTDVIPGAISWADIPERVVVSQGSDQQNEQRANVATPVLSVPDDEILPWEKKRQLVRTVVETHNSPYMLNDAVTVTVDNYDFIGTISNLSHRHARVVNVALEEYDAVIITDFHRISSASEKLINWECVPDRTVMDKQGAIASSSESAYPWEHKVYLNPSIVEENQSNCMPNELVRVSIGKVDWVGVVTGFHRYDPRVIDVLVPEKGFVIRTVGENISSITY